MNNTPLASDDTQWPEGFIHVYTGDGKGKTTASLGLALRAAGAGLYVYIIQFVKGMWYAELESLERYKDFITIHQAGRDCFIRRNPEPKDIQAAREGLEKAKEIINSGRYRLVILDEANIAVHYNLYNVEELLEVIQNRPRNVEIVITGRKAHPKLIDAADLVTEMNEVKHYYAKGVSARRGIEK